MTMMTGRQALMELLRNEGVEYVFGIPGATEILFMDALEKSPEMKYILGLHEVVIAGMAEGYARATGKPGFLNLHTGPGTAASLGMICNAQAGGVPMVITVGQQHSRLLQRDPHLSGDIVGMGKVFTKWCTEIVHGEDLPVTIQRAFKVAMQSLWTAARYKIPVTFVITNNAVYRQVKLVRKIVLGDYLLNENHLGMELDESVINFSLLAESMGVKGERVERPEDLNHVLNTAMDSEEPRLVEVFVENR